ncbi:MAG: MoaD family protein [Treponema sp.]|nr:MoaD family protein [Treponema sp.]
MRVKFFAYLRDMTGCSETDVPAAKLLPADTLQPPAVGDLARFLCERYGPKFKNKMLTADGELGPDMIVMINGRHIAHLGGLGASLKDDDTVQIFPKVAGG